MTGKFVVVVCAFAFTLETISAQCIGAPFATFGDGYPFGPYGAGWGYDALAPFDWGYGGWAGAGPYGYGLPAAGFALPTVGIGMPAASFGGGLTVTSASPIAPTGLTVTSENAIEGALAVIGQLPFLGAVATDGAFPSVGAGAVSYGCGDGAIAIIAELPIAPAVGPVGPAIASMAGPYGYGPWAVGRCGCGVL
ncbi:chorion class CB protein PC404 [Manduca sexta]|uniref:Uncharacterized protein n=1 Tax=Manduca sexta TaxID=7130 RepID=A0A922CFJ2_MANSE|nr:chorion class CB protein PC404 [Manduca sexta]KAG6444396.1 hypothetical protein O3G_MSEX003285 [Manduca sexta]KAG6444397.1 hypothetical protein O3G_MSEX003285 [Manduca sexta]